MHGLASLARAPLPPAMEHAPDPGPGQQSGEHLRAAVRALLAPGGMTVMPPGPQDYVIMLRGVPVAPWIPRRPVADVWGAWLRYLEELCAGWASDTPAGAADQVASAGGASAWDAWRREHVWAIDARHVHEGVNALVSFLMDPRHRAGGVHLIGHSVGGATLLVYLTGWRAGLWPEPRLRLRSAVTLDAAVAGLAGAWSGAQRYLSAMAGDFPGVGSWAAARGIALLTVANRRDWWSHGALADLPYLGLRSGPPFTLLAQLNGSIHDGVRRMPQLVEALWGQRG
jgi:hypothetical protein